MNNKWIRITLGLLVVYLLGFLGVYLYVRIMGPPDVLLLQYVEVWFFFQTGIIIISNITSIHGVGLIFGFSLLLPGISARSKDSKASYPIPLGNLFILMLVFVLLFGIFSEIVRPAIYNTIDNMLHRSELVRQYKEEAVQAYKNDELVVAEYKLRLYRVVNDSDQEVNNLWNTVKDQLSIRRGLETSSANEGAASGEDSSLEGAAELSEVPDTGARSAAELFQLAREYFGREDYFSAHYYARLASRLDPTREDAVRLASRAWQRIANLEPSKSEQEGMRLFDQKREAYRQLMSGDPIGAYYKFKALHDKYPMDSDVKQYLSVSAERINEMSFFLEEIERNILLPGVRDVLFINNRDAEGNIPMEIVRLGKLVDIPSGTYIQDIEVIKVGADGTVRKHFFAPFGKVISGKLVMRCLHKERRDLSLLPTYYKGQPPENERFMFTINPSISELEIIGAYTADMQRPNILQLWKGGNITGAYGYAEEPFNIAMLVRMFEILLFAILMFLIVPTAWRMRKPADKGIVFYILMLAVMFVVLYLVVDMFSYLNRLLISYLLLSSGFLVTVFAVLGIYLVILIPVLYFFIKYGEL